jgi:hypothetical protein
MIRMMITIAAILLSISTLAHADLATDLRQLRNTISETSKTSKELGGLVGPARDSATAQSTNSIQAVPNTSGLSEGDILVSKIANIKLYQDADKKAKVLTKLGGSDELIYTGIESNGFYSIASNNGEGWVEKILVRKR